MRFLGTKYAKNTFAAGAPPETPLGCLQRSPDLAGYEGPTFKGMRWVKWEWNGKGEKRREMKETGGEGKGKGTGREGKVREGKGSYRYLFSPLRVLVIHDIQNSTVAKHGAVKNYNITRWSTCCNRTYLFYSSAERKESD